MLRGSIPDRNGRVLTLEWVVVTTFTFQFISRVRSVTNPWLWVAALHAFPSVGRLLGLGGGRFPQRICSLVIARKGNVRADSSALPAVTFDLSLGDAGSRKDPGSISGYVPWLPCTHFGSCLFSSFSFSRPRFDDGCTLGGVVERPWLWWVSFVGFPLKRESWLHAFPPVGPHPPTKGRVGTLPLLPLSCTCLSSLAGVLWPHWGQSAPCPPFFP